MLYLALRVTLGTSAITDTAGKHARMNYVLLLPLTTVFHSNILDFILCPIFFKDLAIYPLAPRGDWQYPTKSLLHSQLD